jgi:hypothetical protein
VQGISTAVGGGAGVLGRSSDGVGTGIIGENFGGGVAILGRTGAGGGNALEARSSSATGNALFAYNDGFGTAVYGASPNGLAGRFDGPVTINGNLNVSGSTNISPSVNHDSTLSGNGTSGSPLAVVSVPNGVVTTSSYANPSWITSLDGGRITGKVASAANADTATNAVAKTGDTMTGALTLPVNGLQAGGNQLVLAGNNVGIGTANPAFKLDVAGTVNASQLSATSLKLPQGTIASDSSSLTLKGLTTAQGTTGGYLSLGSGNSYYPGGSVKLGAGAAGPDYGAAPGPFISLSGNDYSSGGDIMIASGHAYGSPTGGVITLTTSSASGYNYPPPGYISLQIAGSESLRVASDGNVGIGTSSPAAKFHVANAGATAAQFDGNITVNGNLTVSGSSNVSATVNHDPTLSGNGSSGSPLAVVSAPNGVVTTASYANPSWITSLDGNKITAGTVVKTVNGLTDSVTLAAGSNVTITPSGNTLTINATAAVQKVNPQQVAVLRWYEARSGISFPVGVNPQEMAFDGSNIWVINGGSNSVTKFSANDGSVLGTYAVGAGPNEILFDGANIWVANIVGSITKLRASDGALVGTYPTDKPTGLTFDGTFIWVANNNSGELTKIRASDGSTSLGKGMNGNPYKIVFDGASYWYTLPFHGGVCRFNPAVGDNCLDLGPNTQGLAFDGTNIWVATYGDNTVKKIRVSDRTLVGTYAVGSGPLRVVFDGVNIWVTNTLSNTVTKLRASDGSNLGDFSTGSSPVGIVFDGANVWVSNANSNTISKF